MMFLRYLIVLFFFLPGVASAWQYSKPVSVNELRQPRTFYHLESSGNRSIAISKSEIAVVWEDNRTGKAEIYIAFKTMSAI